MPAMTDLRFAELVAFGRCRVEISRGRVPRAGDLLEHGRLARFEQTFGACGERHAADHRLEAAA